MTRQEAIDALVSAWAQRDQEFVVSADGARQSDAEMREALHALGVSDAEIDHDD
jgi:hypothetical protein